MNKKLLFLVICFSLSVFIFAEDKKVETSKYDEFLSKSGQIIRFEDYSLTPIRTDYASVETRVRKVFAGPNVKYYFQLSKESKYGTKIASIEYSDLLETLKAIDTLIGYSEKDKDGTIEYFENKFMADGFEIGYFKSKGISWYMNLSKYGSDGSVYFKDINAVKIIFNTAKEKIEALK